MNFCIISGHIIGFPTLILTGENTPATVFVLNLTANHRSAGMITVVCRQPLALVAAKYLRYREYVVIEGHICHGEIPWKDGTSEYDVHLVALEILSCEGLRLE